MPIIDFLQRLCSRPQMFLSSGTFEEAMAFLEGYDYAVSHFSPEGYKATSLREFGQWLSDMNENAEGDWFINGEEVAANLGWSFKFRKLYPIDSEAFEALPRLYQQFVDDPQRAP